MGNFAGVFTTQQGAIGDVIGAINNQVNSSPGWWKGPRADRMRHAWPEYQTALRNLADLLGDCANEVRNAASGLEQVGS